MTNGNMLASRKSSCPALGRASTSGLRRPAAGLLRGALVLVLVLAALVGLDAAAHGLLAQTPFGGPRPTAAPPVGGIVGWLLERQSEFYREMSAALRRAKSDGSAVWTLLAVSFAYGIFHAAGPGHGKAVISSYLIASGETVRRGIVLSFASALLQALVAITIVAVGAWILQATAKSMCSAEHVIEIASYALIAALGARLVWVKGGGFMRALRPAATSAPAHHHDHHDHHAHDHGHDHHHHAHGHDHAHHGHDAHCGHSHGPEPAQLSGQGGWQRGVVAVLTVGIRPCSGAILVLVFALAQGLFWAGIASTLVMGLGTAITVAAIAILAVSAKAFAARISRTRDGSGALIMKGIEFAAAGLVLLLGAGLLLGYVAAERATCL